MKKSIIALSALLLASPVFAAETATNTAAHASNEVVAEAHKGADTAKEKLHQSQDKGEELKLKAKHAAEGKSDSVGSKVSEGSQKAWHSTKQGTEKAWDKTKQGAESLKTKRPVRSPLFTPRAALRPFLLPADRACPKEKGAYQMR